MIQGIPSWPAWAALALAAAVCAAREARPEDSPPEAAFARGVYDEEFRGDLVSASAEYGKVLASSASSGELRAEAKLRLGFCSEMSGDASKARTLLSEILLDPSASPSQKTRASLMAERLEAVRSLESMRRQLEHLADENQRFRKDLSRLEGAIKDARELEDEKSREERQSLLEKIRGLQEVISAREKERDVLKEKIARISGRSGDVAGEAESAERILERLEMEKQVRLEERKFLAENYYENGIMYKNRGEYDKAVDNLQLCLEICPDHQDARMQILVVKALLGQTEGESRDAPPDVILEIEKQVWISQKRLELATAFSDGVEQFRLRDFDKSYSRFKRVVDIISAELRMPGEFENQLAAARRYMTLAKAEKERSASQRGDSPVVTTIQVFSFPEDGLSRVLGQVEPEFRRASDAAGRAGGAVWAEMDSVQGDMLVGAAEKARGWRSEGKQSYIMENAVEEKFEKTVDSPRPGGMGMEEARCGLDMRIKPALDVKSGAVSLEMTAFTTIFHSQAPAAPGRAGQLRIPRLLSQSFRIAAGTYRGNTLIILGLLDPFASGLDSDGGRSSGEWRNLLIVIRLSPQ